MAKIGLLVGQGTSQLGSIGSDVTMTGQSKSSVIFVDRNGNQTPVHCCKQCEWSSVVIRDSRYGHRGVRIGEAQNPGPRRTRARVRMEKEAEIALTNLETAITRIIRAISISLFVRFCL